MHDETILNAARERFGRKRVLVAGDVMLDQYMWGEVERISPEAPVPVLRPTREATRAGGAGNVALNLASLGLDVAITGFVGDDAKRDRLLQIQDEAGVDTTGLLALQDRPTVTKTRIIAGHQHVLRVDAEVLSNVDAAAEERLTSEVTKRLEEGIDAIVLSDYAKGTLSATVCSTVLSAAKDHGTPVMVDPKGEDWAKYAKASLLTPNLKELELASGVSRNIDATIEAGRRFVADLDLGALVLTRGADGMTMITADDTRHSPAIAREVFDVSGAGDTVIAALTAGTLAGLGREELLHLANVAASIVVARVGTVPVDRTALLQALAPRSHPSTDFVFTKEALADRIAAWKRDGETVVFTNGVFDIVHAGHATYLQHAAREGDRLVVGINSDASVRRLKGDSRPVNGEDDRACVVAAFGAVDAVVLFGEDTPIQLIEAFRPDVLVKGGDYEKKQIVGAAEVESWGGRVEIIPLVEGRSTTDVIRKLVG